MKITVLMEDTCDSNRYEDRINNHKECERKIAGKSICEPEHGLSLYIESGKHRILMDTGASDKTIANAHKLGIDLKTVDTVFLSHGHYDHGGGILPLQKENNRAPIYIQKAAVDAYYHGERYIGIDSEIAKLPNVRIVDEKSEETASEEIYHIDEELSIFSKVTGRRFWPKSNCGLSMQKNGINIQDDFSHEQCLVIHGSKEILISGCAHNGILNILDRYRMLFDRRPDVVISGFHMVKKTDYTREEYEMIQNTAQELAKYDTLFYTGHCTGQSAFQIMKPFMGERLKSLNCGLTIFIGDYQ